MTRRDLTPMQRAAVLFVAALAENVDENRGILATNGTPRTRAKVAALVRKRFFGELPTMTRETTMTREPRLPDLTDLVTWMRKVDAMHEPSEANALLTAGAAEIERLRRAGRRIARPWIDGGITAKEWIEAVDTICPPREATNDGQ